MGRYASNLVCAAWLALPVSTAFAADDGAAIGEKLYSGGLPLTASIAGHHDAMPAGVVICTNCHGAPLGRPGSKPAAPDLRHGWLSEIRSRRNGPAGHYDQASFCRALRSGIDPVYVMLPTRMPRFTIPDSDCEALWIFLESKS
jgi:hypothetical protein